MTYHPLANLIFFDVPKSGTTSVKNWLYTVYGGYAEGEAHMLPLEYIDKKILTYEQFCRAQKLIVARNIYDRFLSAFEAASTPEVPFDYFLGLVLAQRFHPYCRSICDYLPPKSKVEIVRFEALAESFPGIRHINKTIRHYKKNPYTQKTISRIQDAFGNEIRLFGWKYEESEGVRLPN